MASHSSLTGSELHEPKGVASANSGEAYLADGAGSGSWTDPLASVNNLNTFYRDGLLVDISTASNKIYFPIVSSCNLTRLDGVLTGTIATADAVISIYKNAVLQTGTLTVANSGSGVGVASSQTLGSAISFVAGDVLELRTDGASTNAEDLFIALTFTAS